jgi:LPXTG-site transpeptidase (sortase) family protein
MKGPVTISGNVTGSLADFTPVTLSWTDGTLKTTHPGVGGAYSITVPYGWSGEVTPSLDLYTFDPDHREYTNIIANATSQNYLMKDPVHITGNIFGTLADFTAVTLSWTDGTLKTTHPGVGDGSSAAYSIAVPYGWSGTVTPSLDGYAFTPDHLDYANVIADTLHQNYSVAASLGLVQSLGASSLLGPGGAAGPDTLITSDPPDPNSTTAIFTFTSPDSPVTFECQLDAAGFEACTSPTAYDALTDGSHTFEVRAVDDQGTPDPSPSSQSWVINGPPQVLDQGLKTTLPAPNDILAEGQVVTAGVSEFTITFSGPLYDPSGDTDPNDVTNPANYLLVRDDGDGFQTLSCKDGVQSGDTAITIDSVTYDDTTFTVTLGVNGGLPLSNGIYRMYACGTTSLVDAGDHSLKLAGDGKHAGTDYVRDFIVADAKSGGGNRSGSAREDATLATSAVKLPTTGFPPGVVTLPAGAPHEHYAAAGGMVLEIPALSVRAPIVGIARQGDGWQDLFGLGNNAGYLEGSAYPTWPGNTVLTGHVIDASGAPGIFANLKELQANDKVSIHFGGQVFVYVVRANTLVAPVDVAAVFEHKSYNWLTLLTCEDYNPTNSVYAFRRVVRAVLISVVPEQ